MIVAPTGITIRFDGDGSGLRESRPVVARIFGFAEGHEEPVTHQMVVPAGQAIEQPLDKGLYSVELTLSSGRVIQRNIRISDDSNETFRFLDDLAGPPGFSLQDAVTQSGSRIMEEAAAASAAESSSPPRGDQGLTSGPGQGGPKGLVRRLRRDRPATMPPGQLQSERRKVASLAVRKGWTGEGLAAQPPADGWTSLAPTESDGTRALWRVTHAAPGQFQRQSRKWARIARADGGTEIASLPLPWFCTGSQGFAHADILVDPDRSTGAATRIAVNDEKLAGLLAFLDQGQASSARPMLEELERENVIEETIYTKMSNPLAACAAAYVGLAVYPPNEQERWDGWLRNCMERFPGVPDAAIVHARRLILRPGISEDQTQAAAALRKACAAGVPYFSAGIFLLREMLLQLSVEHPDFVAMAEDAGRIAGRVDAGQIFTVLRYAPTKEEPR